MKTSKINVLEDIKQRILTMELEPREDLDEQSLSRHYGLSRTPVREVLWRLAAGGYVEIRAKKGARVAPMDHSVLRSFFQVAPMIYATIGRLATHNFTDVQLADLRETQSRFRRACESRDVAAMVHENNSFHEIMGAMSGNLYLQLSLSRLLIDHARIGHTFFNPRDSDMQERLSQSIEHHEAIIEALAAQDGDTVAELIYEHWELSRENMALYIAPHASQSRAFDRRIEASLQQEPTR